MDVFAANDLAAFTTVSGTPTETTANVDTTYTPKALLPNSGIIQSAPFMNPTTGATVALTDLWMHMDHYTANNGANNGLVEFVNSSGTSVVRISCTSAGVYRIDYWNGAAWVSGATTFNVGGAVRATFDVHIVCGLSGSLNVYFNNTLQLTTTGLNAAVDNVQSLKFSGSPILNYSQILVSDTNTIGVKVASLVPNANSATNTAWLNDFNNIVKTGFNDATLISSTTLGDKESYAATDASVPAGFTVSSVWFAIRARLNGSAPANIKPLLRIGGVDYAGAYNFPGLNTVSFGPSIAAFPTDPSGGAWGVTNANAAEVGVQTAT